MLNLTAIFNYGLNYKFDQSKNKILKKGFQHGIDKKYFFDYQFLNIFNLY